MIAGLKRGDTVLVAYSGKKDISAKITLISPNGKSLVISFDAMPGGHVGMMPVATDDAGNFYSLIEGLPLTLRPSGI